MALPAVPLLGVNAFDMLGASSAARAVAVAVPKVPWTVPVLAVLVLAVLLLAVASVSTGVHSSSRTVTKPSLEMAIV